VIDTRSSAPATMDGGCHCGAVRFRVTLTNGLASARRCTCSICRMRGAIAVTSTPSEFEITKGWDQVATYQFNTRVAEHHFCKTCGIYTHHRRRSNPDELGVNLACIDGLSPFDFREIVVNDGSRHSSDNADGRTYVAGVLRFEPADG